MHTYLRTYMHIHISVLQANTYQMHELYLKVFHMRVFFRTHSRFN